MSQELLRNTSEATSALVKLVSQQQQQIESMKRSQRLFAHALKLLFDGMLTTNETGEAEASPVLEQTQKEIAELERLFNNERSTD